MNGELRALGLVHGLLLGLVLGFPLVAPDLLNFGMEALFILSAFQLRLTDQRWTRREGWDGWISHLRMAPGRLIPWIAAATVAVVAGDADHAGAILLAALLCEMLVYPLGASWLGRLSRPMATAILLLLLIAAGLPTTIRAFHYIIAFWTGMITCLFWLRGPDGEIRALCMALTGVAFAVAVALAVPSTLAFAFPAAIACATLALAHLSVLRRRPVPWRSADAISFGRGNGSFAERIDDRRV